MNDQSPFLRLAITLPASLWWLTAQSTLMLLAESVIDCQREIEEPASGKITLEWQLREIEDLIDAQLNIYAALKELENDEL